MGESMIAEVAKSAKPHVCELFTRLEQERTAQYESAAYWAERWALMGVPHLAQESKEEAKLLAFELTLLRASLASISAH